MHREKCIISTVILVLGFGSATLPSPAFAQYFTGNKVYELCSTAKTSSTYYQDDAFCAAYIAGVADDLELIRIVGNRPQCIPAGVTVGQLRDVVLKRLRENPAERHLSAAAIARFAIMEAYPACGTK